MKTTFKYDHYYKYDELKENLETFADKYPDLVTLEVNCVTEEGRNQYAVTMTNKKTGDALSKPGWYLDGNIHAGEVTSSMCAMHTIDYLVTNYENDEEVTDLLDHYTIYVIPRVTPDGAEVYLTSSYSLRSVNREYLPEEGGVKAEDLDGDGVVRMMKIKTPYGAWKNDAGTYSGLKLREPCDTKGEFFDIYPEGSVEAYDGENLKLKKASWGLDFNRNFPYGWFPEYRQAGAGKYPLSNPECKALCDFVLSHPNIGGAAIGHTSGGIILYPPGTRAASTISKDDEKAFKMIAEMGKNELGYEPMNIFDSFMDDQVNYDSGAFDDWCYQTQGIPAYTMEFWDISTKAGVPIDWNDKRGDNIKKNEERFNATLKWVKENAPEAFMEWKPFNHPVLGKVEIGGVDGKFTFQNPPAKFLLNEVENDTKFNIKFVKSMPKLVIDSVKTEKVADSVYKVSAVIGNMGYLPTCLSDEAVKLKVNHGVNVTLSGNVNFISGKGTEDIGDLSGFSHTKTGQFFGGNLTTLKQAEAKKKVTWIITADPGTEIVISASQEKSGKANTTITL